MTTAVHQSIPLPLLRTSSTNPRKHFDKAALDELAASLKEHGILQPILVRPLGNLDGVASHDCFEIVAGERRYRAAKIAKLAEVPATVRELTDKQVVEIQVIENVQREDLHPLEEAEGYEQLVKHHGYDDQTIADKVGKSKSYVEKRRKLCALGEKVREEYLAGKIDMQKAFLIARIPHEDIQIKAFAAIAVRHLSAHPERLMFVWHMDDSLDQLRRAAMLFNFVAIGSCAEFDVQANRAGYFDRLRQAGAVLDYVEISRARRPWVHLMRGLAVFPQAIRYESADSTNIARNHHCVNGSRGHVRRMADRIAAPVTEACRRAHFGATYPTTNFEDAATAVEDLL